nr:82_t:CDS:2 [Entrophospora candida]
MSNLVIKIEKFLLEGSFNTICGVTVVYLTMEGTIIPPYNSVRDLADRVVNSALTKIERRMKVLEVLPQSLGDLPNGGICLSTSELQSLASKARRNLATNENRMGKKPDVMGLSIQDEKILELVYTESLHILCNNSKKADDDVKLWREALDGASFISELYRPVGNQFGIVGIQIAGSIIYLNILVKDLAGIPRYFHVDHAEIPLTQHKLYTRSLIRFIIDLKKYYDRK